MLQVEMSASLRSTFGKGAMRRLRMQGMTPAVVYGGGDKAMSLQLESKTLLAKLLEFYRLNTVVTLKIDGEVEKKVLMSDVQTHPVSDALIHIDFCEIDLAKDRAFDVPVVFEGDALGVDLGGTLFINHATVVFEGKPMDIPDQCVLDITDLNIGESLKCSAIAVPEGVRLLTDQNETIVAVAMSGRKDDEGEEGDEEIVTAEGEETAAAEESSE